MDVITTCAAHRQPLEYNWVPKKRLFNTSKAVWVVGDARTHVWFGQGPRGPERKAVKASTAGATVERNKNSPLHHSVAVTVLLDLLSDSVLQCGNGGSNAPVTTTIFRTPSLTVLWLMAGVKPAGCQHLLKSGSMYLSGAIAILKLKVLRREPMRSDGM